MGVNEILHYEIVIKHFFSYFLKGTTMFTLVQLFEMVIIFNVFILWLKW
jgi:hypothetical protein